MGKKKLLVIGAHSADFVWRAAGTIALVTSQGGSATVIALSYGERGESGELWKEPGPDHGKRQAHPPRASQRRGRILSEPSSAALIWAIIRSMISDAVMEQLVDLFREMEPHIVLTHTPLDPFNPDHPVACQAVQRARLLASGAGVASAFKNITPPDLYFFEPHQPELCEFNPNTFVDITPVMEQKIKAMEMHAGAKLPAAAITPNSPRGAATMPAGSPAWRKSSLRKRCSAHCPGW